MATRTRTKRQTDVLKAALTKAIKAANAAAQEVRGDGRTACSVCEDHVDAALRSLNDAADWYSDLVREQERDDREWERLQRQIAEIATAPEEDEEEEHSCAVCESDIDEGDMTICSGCDREVCSECMGDSGTCLECEEDGE